MDTVINLQVLCVVLFGHLDGSRDFIPFLSVFLLLFPSNPPQSHHSLLGGNVKRLPFNDHLIRTREILNNMPKMFTLGFQSLFLNDFFLFLQFQLNWYDIHGQSPYGVDACPAQNFLLGIHQHRHPRLSAAELTSGGDITAHQGNTTLTSTGRTTRESNMIYMQLWAREYK